MSSELEKIEINLEIRRKELNRNLDVLLEKLKKKYSTKNNNNTNDNYSISEKNPSLYVQIDSITQEFNNLADELDVLISEIDSKLEDSADLSEEDLNRLKNNKETKDIFMKWLPFMIFDKFFVSSTTE